MSKKIEYPLASFKMSLELAKAVSDLGGSCNMEIAAEKMGRKLGGGFQAIISAAGKFGLIIRKQRELKCSDDYNQYKLSYNKEEEIKHLQKFFLRISLFKVIYEKYKKSILPVKILDKILIKEMGVEEKAASRVSKYFIDGAKFVGILKPDDNFNEIEKIEEIGNNKGIAAELQGNLQNNSRETNNFVVSIVGPGMNHKIEIKEKEDIDILNAILKKVIKRFDEDI